MKPVLASLPAALLLAALASPAFAALKIGDMAPDFTLQTATAGKVGTFSLKTALKSGPVVVYFYPKAFTGGCSLEAHDFSEAMDRFSARHISVVGVSTDQIATLKKFSTEKCQGRFPVAADTSATVTKAYDAKMPVINMSSRVSYIVGSDGKIAFVHDDPDAATHVSSLLAAAATAR